MNLSKSEEQLMQYLWKLKKAFLKDLLAEYPKPKPADTTVATLLKRMTQKGYVGYEKRGRAREYYPDVSKPSYFRQHFNDLRTKFFGGSSTQLASFFASETNLSEKELRELKDFIEEEIEKKMQ